jgi:hypothetical protein
VVPITSFLPSVMRLGSHSDGCTGALLQSQWGALGLCVLWEAGFLSHRGADCHSVEELGFQLLDRRDGTFLQGGAV